MEIGQTCWVKGNLCSNSKAMHWKKKHDWALVNLSLAVYFSGVDRVCKVMENSLAWTDYLNTFKTTGMLKIKG